MTTREIPLTRGYVALINEVHWPIVEPYRWYALSGYAAAYGGWVGGKNVTLRMHRLITGAPPGIQVDHINHNTCDNRFPENLRLCTPRQNNVNARLRQNSSSGYKGVSRHSPTGRWAAYATLPDGRHHLGLFDTSQEAAQAYNAAMNAAWGEWAHLNESVPSSPINRPGRKNNSSGYRGVSRNRPQENWVARITDVHGRRIYLGVFDDPWEAAQAVNVAARAAWGEAAYTNVRHPDPAERLLYTNDFQARLDRDHAALGGHEVAS